MTRSLWGATGRGTFGHAVSATAIMLAGALASSDTLAATFAVTTAADSGAGSLRAAIDGANGATGPHTITFDSGVGTIALSSALPVIKSSVTIDGSGASGGSVTIDGGGANRIFFAGDGNAITVNLANLALENGSATGGNGGASAGGGMGAGGALFINKNVTATISNVQFADNAATGGNGSGENGLSGRGGGGGLGGDGGSPSADLGAGGGGGGYHGDGGDGGAAATSNGGGGGGGESGDGGDGTTAVAGAGGTGGGGGGGYRSAGGNGATFGGGGGGGKGYGGNGGDFGGGGGSNYAIAGDGGFGGGGGGGSYNGGDGGFGGGGGSSTNNGSGGEGAGAGAHNTGGGGAGLGGAIFVRDGATLTIVDSGFSGGSVTGGTGANNGTATGTALFLGADVTYRIDSGTVTLSDTLGGIGGTGDSDGGLIKTGAGVLELTGTNSYTGDTTVSAGRLVVNGAIDSSNVTVSGGTLGGSGSVGGVLVGSGGTLAPGNSIGTLSVTGNWELASGGTYQVELKNGGNTAGTHNDLTDVAGTAVIKAGSTIKVMPENGTDTGSLYTTGTTYTILTSGGLTVTGAPAISDDFAFLDFTGSYDALNYYLTSNIPSLCLTGATDNQCATGNGVASLGAAAPLYQEVLNLSNAAAGPGLDALSGEGYASMQGVLSRNGVNLGHTLLDRIEQQFDSLGPAAPLNYASSLQTGPSAPQGHGWAAPFALLTDLDSTTGTAGLNATSAGILMGGDVDLQHWLVGGFAGAGQTHVAMPDRATTITTTDLSLGAYAGREFGQTTLALGGAWTHAIATSTRQVQFGGINQTLVGAYGANTLSAFSEVSHELKYGASALIPYGRLGVIHQTSDAFVESGGSAALTIVPSALTQVASEIGIGAQTQLAIGTTLATLSGGIGWRKVFSDAPRLSNQFSGGQAFAVVGGGGSQDTLLLDAGLTLDFSPGANLSLTYDGQFSRSESTHGIKASLAVAF